MAWYDFNKTEVVKPTMADLRKAAEAEYSDGSRYGIRPEGYEKYGDMDWFGGRPTRPTWTGEDQIRINQFEVEQQMYNENRGKTYQGGPLSRSAMENAHPAMSSDLDTIMAPLFEARDVQVSPFRGNPYPPGPLSASRISEVLNERRKKQANADLITKVNLRF